MFFCVFSLLWFEVSITNLDFRSRFTVSSIIFHLCAEEYGQRLGVSFILLLFLAQAIWENRGVPRDCTVIWSNVTATLAHSQLLEHA